MGQQSLSQTSVSGSRSTIREAGVCPDVSLGLGKAVTATLGLLAAVFSVLSLENLSKRFEVGLEGVLGVVLGHDGPS